VITAQGPAPADADAWKGVPGKLQFVTSTAA
jgi:hypothetical protein